MAQQHFLRMMVYGRVRLLFRIKTQILSWGRDIDALGLAIVTGKFMVNLPANCYSWRVNRVL